MSFAIYTHPSSHLHVTPPGHPERVARIEAVDRVLADPKFDGADRVEAPDVTNAQILRAHDEAYLEMVVSNVPEDGWVSIDPDTHMVKDSLTAARRAAGATPGWTLRPNQFGDAWNQLCGL